MIVVRRSVLGKRRGHGGVCKKTPSAWSLSPCLTGSLWGTLLSLTQSNLATVHCVCSAARVCSQVPGCIHPTHGDWVCAVRPEGPWTTENPQTKRPARHSQPSQAEPGKYPAAVDNRSEIVERCDGNKGVLPDGEHRGDPSSAIFPKYGPALENKTTTGCTDQRRAKQGMGLLLCTRRAGREAL